MNFHSKSIAKLMSVCLSVVFLRPMDLPLAYAQKTETPPVKVNEVVKASLMVQLRDLSAKYKVAFIVEGSSEDFPAKIPAATREQKADSARDELTSSIADLCSDYDLSPRRERDVFLLLRKYSTTDSIPGLTLPEVGKVAREITNLMTPFESRVRFRDLSANSLLESLYKSLSSGQIERMKVGTSSIAPLRLPADSVVPIAELSSEQQGTLQGVIQTIYLGDANGDARQSQKEIASIVTDGADFCWRVLQGVKSFGCEIALRDEKREKVFIPLSDPGRLRRMSNGIIISKEAVDSGIDTTLSETVRDSVPVSALPAKVGDEDTLQTVAVQVAQKENKTVLLDGELLQKPALIIGVENAASDTQLRGLCAAYGLRMRTIPEGDKRSISRYPTTRAAKLADLHGAILAAIPSPFMRALMAMEAKPPSEQAPNTDAGFDSVNAALVPSVSSDPQSAPEKMFSRRLTVIRSAAARKLRSTLETRVASSKSGKVSLKDLSPAEQTAFANVLMVDYLTCLRTALTSPVPHNIANYDQGGIVCRRVISHGLPCIAIAFYTPGDYGQVYRGGMTMTAVERSALPPSR
jgi:hypothetical protein